MSKEMSPERTMLVGSALEGLLAAKMYGPSTFGPEAIAFYSSQAVKLADAAMEQMATEVVPNVPEMIVEEEVIIKK